jgi:hypothetical protein
MSDQAPGAQGPTTGPMILACSSQSVLVQSAGIRVRLVLKPTAVARFAPAQTADNGTGVALRMRLTLENVRGANDATVLRVFLQLAQGAGKTESEETFIASAGLYGLRRASVPVTGEGLQCNLDVTAYASQLTRAMTSETGEITLAIRPYRPVPEGTSISIERLRLFAERLA